MDRNPAKTVTVRYIIIIITSSWEERGGAKTLKFRVRVIG